MCLCAYACVSMIVYVKHTQKNSTAKHFAYLYIVHTHIYFIIALVAIFFGLKKLCFFCPLTDIWLNIEHQLNKINNGLFHRYNMTKIYRNKYYVYDGWMKCLLSVSIHWRVIVKRYLLFYCYFFLLSLV